MGAEYTYRGKLGVGAEYTYSGKLGVGAEPIATDSGVWALRHSMW